MWILLVLAIGGYLLARHSINRGKRFVRATDFLMQLDAGFSVEEANDLCRLILSKKWPEDLNRQAIERANREAALHYEGKQLQLIKFATSKGFKG